MFERRLSLALLLIIGLAGCGFKLAGTVSLPPQLSRIYLDADSLNRQQRERLATSLERAGAEISQRAEAGLPRLSVALRVIPDRKLVASASTGKTVERISRRLDFNLRSADGALLLGAKSLVQQRDMVRDDDNLLSSGEERSSVIRDLEQALFNQLIHQLRRI